MIALTLLALKYSVTGVVWSKSKFFMKSIPFVHKCPRKELKYEYGLRENRLILEFDKAVRLNNSVSVIDHCSGFIDSTEMEFWNGILERNDDMAYKMYVGDEYKLVPMKIGKLFFTEFKFIVDTTRTNVRFDVLPMNPVSMSTATAVSMKFFVENKQLPDSVLPGTKIDSREQTHLIVLLMSFLAFFPTVALFMSYQKSMFGANVLNDTMKLPFALLNLILFTSIGALEISRLLFVTIWYYDRDVNYRGLVNIEWVFLVPVSFLCTWLQVKTSYMGALTDQMSMFATIGGLFYVFAPRLVSLVCLVFGGFRGRSFTYDLGHCVGSFFSTFCFARAAGFCWRGLIRRLPRPWCRVNANAINEYIAFYSSMFPYGIIGGLLMIPVISTVLDWVWGDSAVDLVLVTSVVLLETAYAAFFGLWRTISRLKNGKAHWHHDHVTYQVFVATFVAIECFIYVAYRRLYTGDLYLVDLIGLAQLGIAAGGVVFLAFVICVCGDYLVSFCFVYISIISPHCYDEQLIR